MYLCTITHQNEKDMRKVIGMGETILDILFRKQQPVAATPGGSSFNSTVSIGRTGLPAFFVGDTGNDTPGRQIVSFLQENGVDTTHFHTREDTKSAVSLAYLDDNNDADYVFYKEKPQPNPHFTFPAFEPDDVVLFGSYYAICPDVHPQVSKLLSAARQHGAILYYDLNFRRSHLHELDELIPTIHANYRLSTLVRGSADDFDIMYGTRKAEEIYERHIAPYCPLFLCTDGGKGITLCTPQGNLHFDVLPVKTVSNVGAGDNFNAGFIYGLLTYDVHRADLAALPTATWEKLIDCGRRFAANVCASLCNNIDREFARNLQK